MAPEANKYGLSRVIPDPIRRQIRQQCGSGCVVCGSAIYTYEHIDPEFSDAKTHDPACMTLLCWGCHDRVTRKLLSKETVKRWAADPKCLEQGFSFGPFDVGRTSPEIVLGAFTVRNVHTLIKIYDDECLSVSAPEREGGPFLVNACLRDSDGNIVFEVINNEWRTRTTNWDVEVVGPRITVRRGLGDVVFCLRSKPPYQLIVERMHMVHKDVTVMCNERDGLSVITPAGQFFETAGSVLDGFTVAVEVSQAGPKIGLGTDGTASFTGGVLFMGRRRR